MIRKWAWEHSPWFTGSAASVVVATDPHSTSWLETGVKLVLIPLVPVVLNYAAVNLLPKIKELIIALQVAKEKRVAAGVAGQLAALQVSLSAALAAAAAKDELIAQLNLQIVEERQATQVKLVELSRQIEQGNDQLRKNYGAMTTATMSP